VALWKCVGTESGNVLLEQEFDESLIANAESGCKLLKLFEQLLRKANRDGALRLAVRGDQFGELSIQFLV